MASTLAKFSEERRKTYQDLKDEAQEAFAQATQDVAEAQKDHDATLKAYADLEQSIADKRAAMSMALMPADIEDLAQALRDLMLQLREKRVELFDVQEAYAIVQQEQALSEAQLRRASGDLREAEAELTQATLGEQRHSEWKNKVADGDLSALADVATALLEAAADPPDEEDEVAVKNIKAATLRIETDIPEDLRERARARQGQVETDLSSNLDLLDDVADEFGGQRENTEGDAGLVALRWIAFERAEQTFRDFAMLAESRYQQALSLLKSVAESKALTSAEQARIEAVALSNGDEEALDREQARDEAQADVDSKKIEIELAIVQALIEDIDADPEADASVADKQDELDDLIATLADETAEYTPAMRDNLERWEAAVPDHIWANLVAYDLAIALLSDIKEGDSGALSASMDSAESSLVAALEAQDKTQRTGDYLEDSIESLTKRIEFMRNAHQQRVLSAARGDH